MFLLMGSIASIIVSVLQISFFSSTRKVGTSIHTVIKNLFLVDLTSLAIQKYVLHYKHFLNTSSYKPIAFVKFFIIALLVALVYLGINALVNRYISFEGETPKKTKGTKALKIISAILFFLGILFVFATIWGGKSFGNVGADQLIINMMSPAGDGDDAVYVDFIESAFMPCLLLMSLFCVFVFSNFKIVYHKNKKTKVLFNDFIHRTISLVLALTMFASGTVFGVETFHLTQLYNAYVSKSTFIEDNYKDPKTTKLVFPEKKRNIIHIYLESMENSYLSKDLGGNMKENLIPDLTKLGYEGYTFSDTDRKFGGPKKATGTQWSVASMVNQMTGLPMKVPTGKNTYGTPGNFFPGAWTFGDILRDEGYEQTVMFGANADFGGLTYLYDSHGQYKIMDHKYALEHNLIPKGYKEFWGYEDDKLYEFAKDELTRLSKTGKPFNFTMETADTHRPGYVSKKAQKKYPDKYSNAIYYSQHQTYKFIEWIKKQPFYENTTIVMIGDHCSMDTTFFKDFGDYDRTQYNVILNPSPDLKIDNSKFTNRQWANFDMFPTILAAMGVKIDGDRLGIGTNLFSDKKTIFEEYGFKKADKQLEKKSVFINEHILKSPDHQEIGVIASKKKK